MGFESFLCFHGTTLKNANKIRQQKKFIVRQRNNHYLGNGVYFFINDFEAAKWWASVGVNKGKTPQVISVQVRVDETKLLDLDTETDYKKIVKFWNLLKSKESHINFEDTEDTHIFDCGLIDSFIDYFQFQAVKKNFPSRLRTSKEFIEKSGFSPSSQQLSVFDQAIIQFDSLINVRG